MRQSRTSREYEDSAALQPSALFILTEEICSFGYSRYAGMTNQCTNWKKAHKLYSMLICIVTTQRGHFMEDFCPGTVLRVFSRWITPMEAFLRINTALSKNEYFSLYYGNVWQTRVDLTEVLMLVNHENRSDLKYCNITLFVRRLILWIFLGNCNVVRVQNKFLRVQSLLLKLFQTLLHLISLSNGTRRCPQRHIKS